MGLLLQGYKEVGDCGAISALRVVRAHRYSCSMLLHCRDWRTDVQRWKEFCDQNAINWRCDRVEDIQEVGSGDNRFRANIIVGVKVFSGLGSNKQTAKHKAAECALKRMINERKQAISENLTRFEAIVGQGGISFADQVAQQCHGLYDQLCRNAVYPQSSADVIAGVIQLCTDTGDAQIVAMGSGSKCINGHNLSDNGTAVQDCHAEVVARRAFMRYLYSQAKIEADKSIFEMVENGKLKVKSSILFLLYISKPPCGDATLFTRADAGGHRDPTEGGKCKPYWNPKFRKEKKMGLLRKKIESGQGNVLLSSHNVQSWEKLKFPGSALSSASPNERLATMSCSDKILKWNTLGLQGALLSRIMEPVYLSAVVIGDSELFHHGHITRGICCRLGHGCAPACQLGVKHPLLLVVSKPPDKDTSTDNFQPDVSFHWTLGMDDPEELNASTGRHVSGEPALICKRKLLASFYSLCSTGPVRINLAVDTPYCAIKATAEDYQRKKEHLYRELEGKGFGRWVKKPPEVDNFSL